MRHILSVLVENKSGVLSRVTGMISRRGFNIDSLSVAPTEDETKSRMTIVVNGDEYIVEQVEKQLNKVIPVIKVKVLQPEAFISRELSLIKVNCNTKQRLEIMQIAQLMNAGIVDVTTNSLTLQLAATAEETETCIALLHPFGIKEICRAGTIALEKGSGVTAPSGKK